MGNIHSKYKFFGGFGLFLIIILIPLFGAVTNVIEAINDSGLDEFRMPASSSIFIIMALLFLVFFSTQCRYLIINDYGITFVNPIFPFLRKSELWDDIDFYILVDENSEYNTHEAIWLIKKELISRRISSFYYSNYEEIKERLGTLNAGKRNYGPIRQFLCIIRVKRVIY